jgi:hypothetical protein
LVTGRGSYSNSTGTYLFEMVLEELKKVINAIFKSL